MRLYIGVTDNAWFRFHNERKPDEVNFWRPGGGQQFRALEQGGLFLFKLHSPLDKIAGGGFFVTHTNLPVTMAWEAFGEKNGTADFESLLRAIQRYRRDQDRNPVIGCTILTTPFFWPEDLWMPPPEDWHPNLVQGKRYSTDEDAGARLWDAVMARLSGADRLRPVISNVSEDGPRYSAEFLSHARLGQGAFRVLVTETYHRRCAMTGERTLPVLQAVHIRPYEDNGPHRVNNGLCLRSDLHILFDRGYVTVTPDYRIEVSRRIREEFENGRDYYALHGNRLPVLPERQMDRPAGEFIEWHNQNRFVA
jgi:putative restriction endonuclease